MHMYWHLRIFVHTYASNNSYMRAGRGGSGRAAAACIYAGIYAYMCTFMRATMHICEHLRIYVHIYASNHACMRASTHIFAYTREQACIYEAYTHICAHTCEQPCICASMGGAVAGLWRGCGGMHICGHLRIYVHIYGSKHAYVLASTHICARICEQPCIYAIIYAYICTYTRASMHI
jgi:hypothetical protein